jgi:hypothetical protein
LTENDRPPSRLVDNPDTATRQQMDDEKLYAGELAAYYRAKFRSLVGWARQNLMSGK